MAVNSIVRVLPTGTITVRAEGEVRRVIVATTGVYQLIAKLLYGSGLRLIEGLRLRVQDVDFSLQEVSVRDGKGEKDRILLANPSFRSQKSKYMI